MTESADYVYSEYKDRELLGLDDAIRAKEVSWLEVEELLTPSRDKAYQNDPSLVLMVKWPTMRIALVSLRAAIELSGAIKAGTLSDIEHSRAAFDATIAPLLQAPDEPWHKYVVRTK